MFVNGGRMHPARWLGLRRENLNSSRRDYTPGTPLGVGPARVQELVVEHLLPLPLGLSQWGRKELLRRGPDLAPRGVPFAHQQVLDHGHPVPLDLRG